MGKTTLKQSALAKAIAFILCVLMIMVCFGSLLMYMEATQDGIYTSGKKVSFYDSHICRRLVYSELFDVLSCELTPGDTVQSSEKEPITDDSDTADYDMSIEMENYKANFSFNNAETRLLIQVTDEDGNVLAQNCDGEQAHLVFDREFLLSDPVDTAYYVTVWISAESDAHDVFYYAEYYYNIAYTMRGWFILAAVISALICIAAFVFLMVAAGHHRDCDTVRAGWQEKIPLDLYLALAVGICAVLVLLMHAASGVGTVKVEILLVIFAALVMLAVAFACICLAACMTIAARLKMGRYFYRHTITYCVLLRVFGWIRKYIVSPLKQLPLVWKAALVTAGVMLLNLILVLCANPCSGLPVFLILVLDTAVFLAILAVAAQLRRLEISGKELASGNIDYKTDTTGMLPKFKAHAENLNSIGEGMNLAVAERMKSERFKTELITNVSHDLKTPLTSIINYVDLLSREDIQNEKASGYINVLQRQSQRLKKLTEDLVDASKASTGAISVDMQPTNVCELLNQAVAEYSDKLSEQRITPVMTLPEYDITIMADGRLLWRVFDNFLSNIRKYSMPGTRAYISVDETGENVGIVFRNISNEQLNVSADELMERFVRGDASRSTEGSGLGLNIARSLTELMGGTMHLVVDGDLFKAQVIFPHGKAQTEEPKRVPDAEPPRPETAPPAEYESVKKAASDLAHRVKGKVRKIFK